MKTIQFITCCASIVLALYTNTIQAQESIHAAGGNATGSSGSVSYSIGQVNYSNQSTSSGKISQGVQQAFEIYSVGIPEPALNISMQLFPNPTSSSLVLQINDSFSEVLQLDIVDMQGKKVATYLIHETITNMDVSNLASASYYVSISSKDTNRKQLFLIVKN